ncbi:hypothetical protein BG004_003456 [Podila humilis]|nr:hypothetical protein BG004_003456 [Podila humilis]
MATTATTISASNESPVVGRSTVNLIGTSGKISNSNKPAKTVPSPVTTVSSLSHEALMSLPSPPASVSAPSPPGCSSSEDESMPALPTPCSSAGVSPAASPETKARSLSPATDAPALILGESAGHSSPETTHAPCPASSATCATTNTIATTEYATSTETVTVTETATATAPKLPFSLSQPTAPSSSADATTFFDDMINAPQPPANIVSLSPTTSLPDLYHDFFDNHPELYDSDHSSDPEMDLDDLDSPLIRARTMADLRRETAVTPM